MHQHGGVEIPGGEQGGDVGQVQLNLLAAGLVVRVMGLHFDGPAVGIEAEVVGGCFVRETHHVVAVLVHRGVTVGVILRGGCERNQCEGKQQGGKQRFDFHHLHFTV